MVKRVIAELDKIAKYIEEIDEPWSWQVVWRIDKVSEQIGRRIDNKTDVSKISKSILNQYMGNMTFLSENKENLIKMIANNNKNNKKASTIYKAIKDHFGKLSKEESIGFIKNVLKNLK